MTLGTLVFSGEGGSSAQSAIDTMLLVTYEDGIMVSWYHATGIRSSEAGNNSMFVYTFHQLMDGLTVNSILLSTISWLVDHLNFLAFIGYTGVEGLTIGYGVGEDETECLVQKLIITTMKASYAYGSFTVGYSNTE